jgi:hypothetical protein
LEREKGSKVRKWKAKEWIARRDGEGGERSVAGEEGRSERKEKKTDKERVGGIRGDVVCNCFITQCDCGLRVGLTNYI